MACWKSLAVSTRHSPAGLQTLEKAEQPVAGLVASRLAGVRRGSRQCLLLDCQRGIQIDLRGLDRLVPEPQRDHRTVDACLEKVHGGGVTPTSCTR